jgi:hypothetical protein
MSNWIDLDKSRPVAGRVVLVKGVVRYGRKAQLMAAKLMTDWNDDVGYFSYWVALKNDHLYTQTIKLKSVECWKYIE